jgi:ankyrin repeat protein
LHVAASYGQLLAVRCLLENGARATATDEENRLPLHYACFTGYTDVARALLEKHPHAVNHTTSLEDDRETPLHWAATNGSVKCIGLLLQHGADIEATTSDGSTALHVAAANGQLPAIKYLLEKGAKKEVSNDKGWLLLHCASANGHSQCVRILHGWLHAKVDSKSVVQDGQRTALHLAAEKTTATLSRALLKCDANANEQMSDGRTALHLAAAKDCVTASNIF